MNKHKLIRLLQSLPDDVEEVLIAHSADGYDSPKQLRVTGVSRDNPGGEENWRGEYDEVWFNDKGFKVAVIE